jgi:small subunit ribosomal protein S16
MVKIRLRRMGAKKQPTYRFVVADSKSPRDGRFIEILGHYNPRTEPKTVVVDEAKAKEWLAKGAQPSEPVRRLFAEKGLCERGPIPETKRKPKNAESGAA